MDHFNDKGHLTDEALALYAEALKFQEVDQLPEVLRGHLESCPQCQEQAMALYALIADQDYSGLGPHPTFGRGAGRTTASILKMWFRPLLLLLMALLAFFLFLQQQQEKRQSGEKETPAITPAVETDSLDIEAPLSPPQAKEETGDRKPEIKNQKSKIEDQKSTMAIAANFTPSETLDPLVGAVTRSGGLSDIRPPAGAELEIGEAVVFSWRASSEEPLTLRLLNNREEEIFSRSVSAGRLDSPVELEPGLYYWKLETADDLLYVGKFVLR